MSRESVHERMSCSAEEEDSLSIDGLVSFTLQPAHFHLSSSGHPIESPKSKLLRQALCSLANMESPHLAPAVALSAPPHSLPSPTSPSSSASSILVVDDSPQAEQADDENAVETEENHNVQVTVDVSKSKSKSTETNKTPEDMEEKNKDDSEHTTSSLLVHPSPPSPPLSSLKYDSKTVLSSDASTSTKANKVLGKQLIKEQSEDAALLPQLQQQTLKEGDDDNDNNNDGDGGDDDRNNRDHHANQSQEELETEILFERRNERPLSEDLVTLKKFPKNEPLPDLEKYDLTPEQLKHQLFVAISKTLLIQGNAWQSALDLVDGIRHFNLANLGGRTPKGSVQGAISTALTVAHQLRRAEPIQKERLYNITYYRMTPEVLRPPSDPGTYTASDITPTSGSTSTMRRKAPTKAVKRKKKPMHEAWGSDDSLSSDGFLSSGSSDDEADHHHHHQHQHKFVRSDYSSDRSAAKRFRTVSYSSANPYSSPDHQVDIIPNGLKKLPKGYVYDTEINQSTLMHLSVNPSQTGEFMELLRDKNERENNFPDRRGEFGLDLTQEPSMFAVEQQTGYAYPRLRTSGRCRLQKEECEDGFAVSDMQHNGQFLGRLFCITDGHGGRACSNFVIATIPGAMQVILGKYKPTDISIPSVQDTIRRQITEALKLIDKEYLEYKKQQYLLFKAKAIPNDPGSDGTTLIVNIFIDKWIINVNLGDSRSMIGSRDPTGRWNVDFSSEDHTPSLERLAHTIYANGGEFVTHDDKIIRFDPNLKSDKKNRASLREARIRVKDAASNAFGIPYRTRNGQCASVNLGACIGDVLYKLDPVNPVLSCTPDVTFIDITTIQNGYLIMASDGLWDYVKRGGKVQDQNATVCQFVGDKLDRGWNHQRIVCSLSDREGSMALYSDSIQEYDDFTAILVTFNREQLLEQQKKRQEYEENQKMKNQQQKLMVQQRQKEIEEIQRLQKQQQQLEMEMRMRMERGTTDEQATETDVSSVGIDSPPPPPGGVTTTRMEFPGEVVLLVVNKTEEKDVDVDVVGDSKEMDEHASEE